MSAARTLAGPGPGRPPPGRGAYAAVAGRPTRPVGARRHDPTRAAAWDAGRSWSGLPARLGYRVTVGHSVAFLLIPPWSGV